MDNSTKLRLTECFTSDLGPGELPGLRKFRSVRGLIVPHASHSFSGACAAWGYKEIGESNLPDVFVIIGSNHKTNSSGFSTTLKSNLFA